MKSEERRINPVYKALNRPLTILGAERKLFFVAMIMGAATFNFLNSLVAGLLIFGSLYFMAQWATRTDSQILRILLNSSSFRLEYDSAKYVETDIRVIKHA